MQYAPQLRLHLIRTHSLLKGIFLGLFVIVAYVTVALFIQGLKSTFAKSTGLETSFSWPGQGSGNVSVNLRNTSLNLTGKTKVKYHLYWCDKGKSAQGQPCSPILSGDKKAKETLFLENIEIDIPPKGQSRKIALPVISSLAKKTCGRFQADLSFPQSIEGGAFIGGKIFVIGDDCPKKPETPPIKISPTPTPKVSPSPVASVTPSPTPRPTASPTPQPSPTVSPNPTATPGASATPSPSPTTIPNTQPECVSLSAHPTFGGAELSVSLIGKGRDLDGNIKRMEFNFGDGDSREIDTDGETNKDTLYTLTHTYKKSGTYFASLRVKDNSGQANEWSTTPESCKVKITVEGQVLGAVATTTLPKAGAETGWLMGFVLSGLTGTWLKLLARKRGNRIA